MASAHEWFDSIPIIGAVFVKHREVRLILAQVGETAATVRGECKTQKALRDSQKIIAIAALDEETQPESE